MRLTFQSLAYNPNLTTYLSIVKFYLDVEGLDSACEEGTLFGSCFMLVLVRC